MLTSNAVDLVWGVICADTAAACGDDDEEGCDVIIGADGAISVGGGGGVVAARGQGLRSGLPRAWRRPAVRLRRARRRAFGGGLAEAEGGG